MGTTRVRQLTPSGGPGGRNAGEEYDEDVAQASRLVDAGHAEYVAEAATEEEPVAKPETKQPVKPRVKTTRAGKPVETASSRPPERRG